MDHEAAQRKREAQAVAATQGRDRGELAVERRPAVQQLLQSRGPPPQTPMIAGRSQRTATGPKSAAGDTFLGKAPTSGMPAVLDQSGAGGSDLIGGLKLRNHPRSARGAVAALVRLVIPTGWIRSWGSRRALWCPIRHLGEPGLGPHRRHPDLPDRRQRDRPHPAGRAPGRRDMDDRRRPDQGHQRLRAVDRHPPRRRAAPPDAEGYGLTDEDAVHLTPAQPDRIPAPEPSTTRPSRAAREAAHSAHRAREEPRRPQTEAC